jgi:hypothetical protein
MGVPKTFEEGWAKNRKGADSNLSVAEGKHRASRTDPGRDASRENADRAKREWKDGGDRK